MDYRVTARQEYFELTMAGAIDVGTYPEMFDALFNHADWKPGTPLLVDESDLRADDLTVSGLKEIAEICTSRGADFGASRMSMYVSRDLEFGLNRMWHVFMSREEAMTWLGVQRSDPPE